MDNQRYLKAVVSHLLTKLHDSSTGYRCRCGQCRHQILVTASRTGIAPRRLIAALPPERPKKEDQRSRRSRSMTAMVAESVTVSSGRTRVTGSGALLRLVHSR